MSRRRLACCSSRSKSLHPGHKPPRTRSLPSVMRMVMLRSPLPRHPLRPGPCRIEGARQYDPPAQISSTPWPSTCPSLGRRAPPSCPIAGAVRRRRRVLSPTVREWRYGLCGRAPSHRSDSNPSIARQSIGRANSRQLTPPQRGARPRGRPRGGGQPTSTYGGPLPRRHLGRPATARSVEGHRAKTYVLAVLCHDDFVIG